MTTPLMVDRIFAYTISKGKITLIHNKTKNKTLQ